MKKSIEEFLKNFTYILCAMVLCISFYNLFVNMFHWSYINKQIIVSELDNDYQNYVKNVDYIKSNLNSNEINTEIDESTLNKLNNGIKICVNYLAKEESLFGIKANQSLKPYDIYQLNSNFSNELYNRCWVSGMSVINLENYSNSTLKDSFYNYNRTINMLVDSSDYIKKELLGNSSYHYRTLVSKSEVRDDLVEQYEMILYNYRVFSDIILEISDLLVRGD